MARAPGGLRLRLTLAICAVSLGVVAVSFFVLREETGAHLRDRIDQDLRDQLAEFEAAVPVSARLTPRGAARLARQFVASQDYHASSRIFAISVRGQAARDQPAEAARARERTGAPVRGPAGGETAEELGESGLLDAPDGSR